MSRPIVPLTGHSSSQPNMSHRQTSNDSQTAAVLARSTQSQIREQSHSQLRSIAQHALSSGHTPTLQPARSNLSQPWQPDSQLQTSSQDPSLSRHTPISIPAHSSLSQSWQPVDSQLQPSSQNLASSRHTPTSQPVWIPPSSPPQARLSQEWEQRDSQPVMHSQQASSSRHASESQKIWVPSSFQPPPRPSQGPDRAFRNSQTGSDKVTDAPLAYDCSMVMDSMASSQATGGLGTQYPPPSSQSNYLPTSDAGIHSDATMIQSPEKNASERHVQSAHGSPDTPQLPLPLPAVSSDLSKTVAPRPTKNRVPTSDISYQTTILPDEISDGLVANCPASKSSQEQPPEPVQNGTQLIEKEISRDMVNKAQGDAKRASKATPSRKSKRVSKRTSAATQASRADPSRSKIVILKIGRLEKNGTQVVPSSVPPVIPLKRSGTYLDDAPTTDASSSHSTPTLTAKPSHVQDLGDRREIGETQKPVNRQPEPSRQPEPNGQPGRSGQPEANGQPETNEQREANDQPEANGRSGPNGQPEAGGQPEADAEDHTQAAHSLSDIHFSLDAFLSKNHQLLAPDPPPNPFSTFHEQMAHLGALPNEERTVFVNKLITEALMNPNFEKLCQEVEGSWKRFGFEK